MLPNFDLAEIEFLFSVRLRKPSPLFSLHCEEPDLEIHSPIIAE